MRQAFNQHLPIVVVARNGFTPLSKPKGAVRCLCRWAPTDTLRLGALQRTPVAHRLRLPANEPHGPRTRRGIIHLNTECTAEPTRRALKLGTGGYEYTKRTDPFVCFHYIIQQNVTKVCAARNNCLSLQPKTLSNP